MKQKISVLLPTFNRAHLIRETIDSLYAQTRLPDEIVIIDDGSTDETPSTLTDYDRLTVVRTENGGKARALNHALAMTSGDLVWILDDDDLLLPEACALLAGPLEADASLDFCAGRHLDFTVDAQSGQRKIRAPGYMRNSAPNQIFPDLLEGCHIFQPGLIVRRRVYDEVGGFDAELIRSQDYEMLLRIARRYQGLQLSETVFLHREHDGQRGSATHNFSAAQNADRWATYNEIIFRRLLNDVADEELIPQNELEALPEDVRARARRIKRGCIMARQRMWRDAVVTWQSAAAMCSSNLSEPELEMLARSPNSALGAPELFNSSEVRAEFHALSNLSAPGPEIAAVVRRASRWHLRAAIVAKDWRLAANGIRFLLRR